MYDLRDKHEFADACEETLAAFYVRTHYHEDADWYSVIVGGNDAEVHPISDVSSDFRVPSDKDAVDYHIRNDLYNERTDWTGGGVMVTVAVIEVATGMFYYVKASPGDAVVDWDHPLPLGEEA